MVKKRTKLMRIVKKTFIKSNNHFSKYLALVFVVLAITGAFYWLRYSKAANGVGTVDNFRCDAAGIKGWAYDPDRSSDSLRIHIYFSRYNNGAVSGRDPGVNNVIANIPRPDVNSAYGISGNHGFQYAIPDYVGGVKIRDNTLWYVYVFAITVDGAGNPDGQNPLLGKSSVNCAPLPDTTPPSAPTNLRATTASTSQINLSWGGSSDNSSGIAGYDIYRNGAKITSTGSTAFNNTGLAANTAYSYFVKARDGRGNVSNASNTASAKTSAVPSTPPKTTPGNGSKPPSAAKPNSSSTVGSAQQGTGGPLTPASNFTANPNVVGVVLSWSLASGGTGDISYQIDRSIDQQDWQSVASSVFGSTYADTTTAYSTAYVYRLRAADSTGATSDYVTASVTTGSYSATDGNSITSDDGAVTATFAEGAIDGSSACAVVSQSETQPVSDDTNLLIIQGPYLLVCRTAEGEIINEFKADVTIAIKPSEETNKTYNQYQIVENLADSGEWQQVESKFDNETQTISYVTQKANTFALSGKTKPKTGRYILIGFAIMVLGGGIFVLIKRKDTIVEWFYRH